MWLLMPVFLVWLLVLAVLAGLILIFGLSKVSWIPIIVLVVFGLLYSFYIWFTWNNSDYIVTNQRVIKIDQVSLFNRVISEAEIHRIQEMSTEISGPIHTMFNFGTVRIKTASEGSRLDLDDVTDPYDVQQVIVQIQKQIFNKAPTPKIV